jgi:hypothetical protein
MIKEHFHFKDISEILPSVMYIYLLYQWQLVPYFYGGAPM